MSDGCRFAKLAGVALLGLSACEAARDAVEPPEGPREGQGPVASSSGKRGQGVAEKLPVRPTASVGKTWATLRLPKGGSFAIQAESPRAPIDRLGTVAIVTRRGGEIRTMSGPVRLLGNTDALVSRAPHHEATEVELSLVDRVGEDTVVRVDLAVRSGEDLQHAYLESSLWLVSSRGGRLRLENLWSGAGGEYHSAFEACSYGVEVEFASASSGGIARRCAPWLTRGRHAHEYSDCPFATPAGCPASVVVAKLPSIAAGAMP